MFCATRTPFRIPTAVDLTHKEFRSCDNGVELTTVKDCGFLCDPDDYDLEVLQRSGEDIRTLKPVSTVLKSGEVVLNESQDSEQNNNNEEVSDNG